MHRNVERTYPFVGAAVSAAMWWHFEPRFPVDEKEFLAAALSLAAILTGFITTAKAILAALPSDSVMRHLRRSGYLEDLLAYLAHAIYGCLLFSLYCLFGFFLLDTIKTPVPRWFAVIWTGLGVFAGLAFFRISRLLFRIIRNNPPAE